MQKAQVLHSKSELSSHNFRSIARGLVIVSLLLRHFDFDVVYAMFKGQAANDVDYVKGDKKDVLTSIYNHVLYFSGSNFPSELTTVSLQAFGITFFFFFFFFIF